MMVKICGITTGDDAAAAIDAGADALGFNFWSGSPRYITPARARAIIDGLPPAILKVGVFVDECPAEIFNDSAIDLAQVHGDVGVPMVPRWWQAWPAGTTDLAERMNASGAEAFLIDAPSGPARGGSGKTYDWSLAAGLPGRVVLAGGLEAANVRLAIETARPWGVDACSRLESAPGKKDHQKMREFVRAVRSAAPDSVTI